MSNFDSSFDNDFDSFLNLDSTEYNSTTASPAVKVIPSLAHHSSSSSSAFPASTRPSFTGPTYQYDSHRQQTGLPSGGLANTFAVNQALGLHYRPNQLGFVMPTETLNTQFSNNFDEFDYLSNQPFDTNDMDFDADSPSDMPSMFYAGGNGESSQSAPIQRIYPGMHTQQAAQAKAAQAQKQQEMLRLQQQPKQIPGQRPLPTQVAKPSTKDPLVEESISRLLNRMRQGSTGSVEDLSPTSTGMSGLIKPKKEEDDMDEDERLLASEEGKKLSSKERRQLRNKVSARAFRSRRKEYIGQLEGEVAVKVQEANELRVQNRQLMEENTRLTDLTRMLLSSQAFSGFLQELSNSGLPAPNLSAVTSTPQHTQTRKDVSVHEASRQLQSQAQQNTAASGSNSETSRHDISNNNWNSLPSNDFQVYAVTSLPQPPVLDMSALTEKKSSTSKSSSKDAPVLPTLPSCIEKAEETLVQTKVDNSIVLDEKSFDLYYESSAKTVIPNAAQMFISSLSKSQLQTEVVSNTEDTASDSWTNLQNMCAELDEVSARLEQFLP